MFVQKIQESTYLFSNDHPNASTSNNARNPTNLNYQHHAFLP